MEAIGITHSTAISALYSQIVLQQGLPFELKIPRQEHGAEAGRALDARRAMGNGGARADESDGIRGDVDDCVLSLSEIQARVRELAPKYGLQQVSLFGSYARGEATAASDVDVLVEKGEARGFALGGFQDDLARALGKDVDVVSAAGIGSAFLQRIADDEVVLYER